MKIVTANRADIPAVGFGTYGMSRDEMLRMIPAALDSGFRHIDTAQIYRNEAEVGECAAASGIVRAELFLTTKVWVSNYGRKALAPSDMIDRTGSPATQPNDEGMFRIGFTTVLNLWFDRRDSSPSLAAESRHGRSTKIAPSLRGRSGA